MATQSKKKSNAAAAARMAGSADEPDLGFTQPSIWQYAPSPESTAHVHFEKRYELFIGGR